MLVLLTLGAISCGDRYGAGGGKKGARIKDINCDPDVDVDVSTSGKGVKKKAVYVCPGETFTWKAPKNHKFSVVFSEGSPFTGSTYDQDSPTAITQGQYPELVVYKYSITVDSNPRVDPQVVAGGN
jgi:hypothetical protein